MVGLQVGPIFYKIGTGSFLHSFFSTVAYHLEEQNWGSKFPVIMKNIYQDELKAEDADKALTELNAIREGLKKFPPNAIIWDIEDLDKTPPWGDNIANTITDLSNYFYTSDGKDLFEVFNNAIQASKSTNKNLIIKSF